MNFEKYKKNLSEYINVALIIIILFFEIFLQTLSFRYDILFISFFVILNIKKIIHGYKDNKILYILSCCYILYKFAQALFLREPNDSLFHTIWSSLYGILNSLLPILFFITLFVSKIGTKYKKILNILLLSFTFLTIMYGIITYIFNIQLVYSGMYVLGYMDGRIVSFFGNPNSYGIFLVMMLIYTLFNENIKKIIKYSFVALIMASICFTYGRSVYFIMVLTIFIYVIYALFNKNMKDKLISIILVLVISFSTLYLPGNNYLYISLIDTFDEVFNTSLTTVFYEEVDKIKKLGEPENIKESEEKITSEEIYNNINRAKTNKLSSVQSRALFFNTALEVFKENKIIGVGSLNYHKYIQKKLDKKEIDYIKSGLPHNYYLYSLVVDGLIGAIILFSILTVLCVSIYKKTKAKIIIPELIYILFLIVNIAGDFMMKYFLVYVIIFISMGVDKNKMLGEMKK